MSTPSPRQRRERLYTFLSVLFGLIVACGVAEVALRIVPIALTYNELQALVPDFWQPGTVIPYTLRPGAEFGQPYLGPEGGAVHIEINAQGMRGPEVSAQKAEGTTRILLLGDSYTFGYGVSLEESYPGLIRTRYAAEGRPVEVINAAYTAGASADTAYAWMLDEGFGYQPDLVIYALFAGNDLQDLYLDGWEEPDARGLPRRVVDNNSFALDDGRLRATTPGYATVGAEQIYRVPLLRNSEAAVAFYVLGSSTYTRAMDSGRFDGLFPAERERSRIQESFDLIFPVYFAAAWSPEMAARDEAMRALIAGLAAESAAQGAQFALILIPLPHEVNPAYIPQGVSMQRSYYDSLIPWLEGQGIAYLDLPSAMRADPGPYYPDPLTDFHMTPAGNAFTAGQLYAWIDAAGLIP